MTRELAAALRGAAQRARGCYNRALRTSDVRGSVTIKVQVEASGDICRTAIESSSPAVAEMGPCLRALFEAKRFPPAEAGCINVNIPVAFSIKEDATDGGVLAPAEPPSSGF